MSTDLNLGGAWTPPAGNAVRLAFGAAHPETPDTVSAAIRIRLGAPGARIRAQYDNRVSRKCEGGGSLGWEGAVRTADCTQACWGDTRRDRFDTAVSWLPLESAMQAVVVVCGNNVSQRNACQIGWVAPESCGSRVVERFGRLDAKHDALRLRWEQGEARSSRAADAFVSLIPRPRSSRHAWRVAIPHSDSWRAGFAPGLGQTRHAVLPWTSARQPAVGESHLPVDPIVPPVEPLHHPQLDFRVPATQAGLLWRPLLRLDFGSFQRGPVSIPILKVYFVSNSVEMVRLPGREPIPVKSVQISIDADSWAWGLAASLPYSALPLIEPGASGGVEVEITINGVTWVMWVEGFDVRREFGQSSLSIRGRSRVACLADPYAPARSFVPASAFTAQQLAAQELTRPGLATGFDLDWRLPDWLVPEGAWSYQGLTPMAAIGRIVAAVGGTLNAHPHRKTLVARSRYPALPWEWASVAPDVELPIDFVKTLGLRWQEKPAYNAIFVAGERVGVTGRVVRAGTAGENLAPMAVDALITHADAARERGRTILADTGRQATVTLELPMPQRLGLIAPGALVAVSDEADPLHSWRGLVRATSISADWSTSLTVRQNLELERHFF